MLWNECKKNILNNQSNNLLKSMRMEQLPCPNHNYWNLPSFLIVLPLVILRSRSSASSLLTIETMAKMAVDNSSWPTTGRSEKLKYTDLIHTSEFGYCCRGTKDEHFFLEILRVIVMCPNLYKISIEMFIRNLKIQKHTLHSEMNRFFASLGILNT